MSETTERGKIDTPTYSMPREIADAVRQVAASRGVSASHVVRAALLQYPAIRRLVVEPTVTPVAA
jgi:hypothetical protein